MDTVVVDAEQALSALSLDPTAMAVGIGSQKTVNAGLRSIW